MICRKCGVEKDDGEFAPSELKRGCACRCKICVKEYQKQHRAKPEVKERMKERKKQYYADPEVKKHYKERMKQYYADPEVKGRIKERMKRYCADPAVKKHHQERMKQYYADPEVRERKKEYFKRYYADPEVRERIIEQNRQHCKRRRATDTLYKMAQNLRWIIRGTLKHGGYTKRSKTTQILGADFETVQKHLGTTPEYEHHIDHICPIAQAQNEEEIYKLNHYTNLRYLPKKENLQKSDKKTPEGEEMCRKLLNREWIGE